MDRMVRALTKSSGEMCVAVQRLGWGGLAFGQLERSFVALNHIAAAIIAFRKVPQTVNVIYG